MIVYLTSSPSGPLDQSRIVDGLDNWNAFVENLKQDWKKDARCLIISAFPEECERNDEMVSFFHQALLKSKLDTSVFDVWDVRTCNVSKETLHSYDVIFLGGGHVPTQNAFFHQLQLRKKLADFSGIIIGISAGTMNSADTVYAQPELPGEGVNPDYVRFLKGLGLTKTMILPHYQMVKNHVLDGLRLFEDITYQDSYGRKFLALCDGSYLLIKDGVETLWGEAYVICDGGIHCICEKNQHIVWKNIM